MKPHLLSIFVLSLITVHCAETAILKPQPASQQTLITAESYGIVLSVPKLHASDYPDELEGIAYAVYAAIENRSAKEIYIQPDDFSLGEESGMHYQPLSPQELSANEQSGTEMVQNAAYRGGRGYYRGGYRGYYRPRVYLGFGVNPWWGWPYNWYWPQYYGYGPRYMIPYSYGPSTPDASQQAVINSLKAGSLPAGGKTAGFLFFPEQDLKNSKRVYLYWNVKAAKDQPTAITTLKVPLDIVLSN